MVSQPCGDGLTRLPACVGLASRGLGGRLHAGLPQDGCRCLHVRQSPGLAPAGERIVEENGLAHAEPVNEEKWKTRSAIKSPGLYRNLRQIPANALPIHSIFTKLSLLRGLSSHLSKSDSPEEVNPHEILLVRFAHASCCAALITAQDHPAHTPSKPATLMPGLGDLHHPVSTKNPQAQQFFDQGLRLIYAFNHDEAARSFQHAARTRSQAGHGLLGHRRGRRTELQRSGQRRPLQRGARRHPESSRSFGQCFARRASLHPGHGAAFSRRSQGAIAAGGRGLSRCHARSGEELSR